MPRIKPRKHRQPTNLNPATDAPRHATAAASSNGTSTAAYWNAPGVRNPFSASAGPVAATRMGASTSAAVGPVNTSSYLNNGYANLGAKGSINLEDRMRWADKNGAALYMGTYLAGWKNFAGMGGSIALSAGGSTVSASGFVSVSADRSTLYLGKYSGEKPQLAGLHQIEIRENFSRSGKIAGGFSYAGLGVGGRLAVSEGKDIVYRSYFEDGQANEAIRAGTDPKNFWKHKAEVLGLQARSIEFPCLAKPQTLLTGDEMVVSTKGKIQGGILLGGFGATVGASASMEGSFHLAVRKLDENKIELAVTPREIKSIALLGNAQIATASVSKSIALALRQSFVFDLSKEDGLDAYKKAIHGILPSNMKDPGAVHENDDERLLAAMNMEELPEGVTRTFMEKAEVPLKSKGVGTGIMFLPKGVNSLAYHQITSKEKQVVADGKFALTRDSRGKMTEIDNFFSGKNSAGVYATIRRVTAYKGPGKSTRNFDRLVLRAHFSDSRVKGDEINDKMIAPINGAFGTTIDNFTLKGHSQSREVTLERVLGKEEMKKIAEATVLSVSRSCAASGADAGALTTLVGSLATEYNPWDRGLLIQSYVEQEGLEGMGALHQLLGGNKKELCVRTRSNSYIDPLSEVAELEMLFAKPIQSFDSKSAINERFGRVSKALSETRDALRELQDDTILQEFDEVGWAAQKEAILSSQNSLRKLTSLKHLGIAERNRVYAKLDSKNLLQQCELLQDKYADPIQVTSSPREIKDRLKEVDKALGAISKSLSYINSDFVLNSADATTQIARKEELVTAQKDLRNLISFAHLNPVERGQLLDSMLVSQSMCSVLLCSRRSETTTRVIGMLEALGIERESDNTLTAHPRMAVSH